MTHCKLPFRDTECEGAVIEFELYNKVGVIACLKHAAIFKTLCYLKENGIDSESLKEMTVDEIMEKYTELKSDGEKEILGDPGLQETSEEMV